MFDKGICDKESIWNPSNCECECDKCWKISIDKLVKEYSENTDENQIHIMVLWMIIKSMQFLYSIHCIISHIFHNKYKHSQYLFSLVLKKWY